MTSRNYDIVVVGAGVIGTAIARALAGTDKSVAMIDSKPEVCAGTSKANTAILHTGYDAKPGTMESAMVAKGYHMTLEYCQKTGVSYETTGAILVAWDDEQAESLPGLKEKAEQNGYMETRLMTPEEVYKELPDIGPGATGGLEVPGETIIDPWSVPLAYATDAVNRGCDLILECGVESVEIGKDKTVLRTTDGPITAGWVINAAGLGGDVLDRMYGYTRLELNPRKGELLVFDKLTAPMAPKIVLAAPSKVGKGVLISPTIFGNVMLGPTADDLEDRTDTSTSEDGFTFLREKGERIMPTLLGKEVTAAYAGLRAANNQSDYLLEADKEQRYLIAGAIRSTGLTSAPAVAEHVVGLLKDAGLELEERSDLPEPPAMPALGEYGKRPYEDPEMIAKNPAYGEVVCFCERVTKGEILDALNSPVPPRTLEGLRRRTRAMNGRCQAFFCGAKVLDQFEAEKKEATR